MSKQEQPKPEYEVDIWINARDSPNRPCGTHTLGFAMKAFSTDYIQLELRGCKDFLKEGAWVTNEELHNFAEKLIQIVEEFENLTMSDTQGVTVLWEKKGEAK